MSFMYKLVYLHEIFKARPSFRDGIKFLNYQVYALMFTLSTFKAMYHTRDNKYWIFFLNALKIEKNREKRKTMKHSKI